MPLQSPQKLAKLVGFKYYKITREMETADFKPTIHSFYINLASNGQVESVKSTEMDLDFQGMRRNICIFYASNDTVKKRLQTFKIIYQVHPLSCIQVYRMDS